MSLKSAVFEIKTSIINQQQGQSEEAFIQELEAKNNLSAGKLIFYYNNLLMFHLNNPENSTSSSEEAKKVNRKWTKNEVEFMFQYILERQEEGGLNITEILEEVAQLLDRGYQSVNYKYYSQIKAKDKKDKATKQPSYQFTTISQEQLPVRSTEVIANAPTPDVNEVAVVSHQQQTQTVPQGNPTDSDDLLDILSGLITNVQQLPGLNLNELLRSLYQLTNMALQNQDAVKQLESVKSEINFEKQALREKLLYQERQLDEEKKRNDELQAEVAKLAKEISAFNKLEDTAKIQNLKTYNQRLNYLIDNFGVVLQVGS
jgi:hypothetical protein